MTDKHARIMKIRKKCTFELKKLEILEAPLCMLLPAEPIVDHTI